MKPDKDTMRLISELLDGTLPTDKRAPLEALLERDAAARRLYLQMVDQEIELACLLAPGRDLLPNVVLSPVEDCREALRPPRRLQGAWWLAGAAAAAGIALLYHYWPLPVPDTVKPDAVAVWSMGFEDGKSPGWTGEVVSTDLPAGSGFGIRPVARPDGGVHIELPADWERGLFGLTPRTTLHITYRRITPGGWLNVFIHTDSGNPAAQQNSMFMLRHGRFPGAAGVWQTASVPFSEFVRKVPEPGKTEPTFTGGPPRDGERVLAMVFDGSPGFDIIVDRIWITPDGPGTGILRPLP